MDMYKRNRLEASLKRAFRQFYGTAKKQAEMTFELVSWTFFDAPSDQVPTEGTLEATNSKEITGDWFKVYFKDGNVMVELDANNGYKRELIEYISDSVSTSGSSQFSVTQDGKVYGEE